MRRKLLITGSLIILALVSALMFGEGNGNRITSADDAAVSGQCAVHGGNPLLANGSMFAGANWNDPSVLKEGSQYVMYASAAKDFDMDIKIYRFVSPDGIAWRLSPEHAVFERRQNAWDAKSTETPSVVRFEGMYYLFYTGYDTDYADVSAYKVGYATSPDGIHWTRATAPLVAPTDPKGALSGDFKQLIVGEPGALVHGGKIYVYFTAVGLDRSLGTGLQTIGLVTSADGATWSEPRRVIAPDQSLFPVAKGWVGYTTPQPVVKDGKVYLFYTVAGKHPDWGQERIAYAVSENGEDGWRQHPAILSRGAFAWTKNRIGAPAVLVENGELKLYFAGDANNNLGIGLATCAL